MRLQIFDVEHGACALLTADNSARLMIDCGHNASTAWYPGAYLQHNNISVIDILAISNYDEDHVTGIRDLFNHVTVGALWRNKSVTPEIIQNLKSEDGMGRGIEFLSEQIRIYTGPPSQVEFSGLEMTAFCNDYPIFDDENNLSMAVFLKCHGIGVMFTGDLERAGFKELLKRESFRQALKATRVYVASHHGREGGCSDEVAALLTNVNYVIISDKGYAHDTQRTLPFYSQIAKGGPFRDQGTRRVLTTRNDGRIAFEFTPGRWYPF
jgi:beta-lactamase superfamily II metal-dependent hydrolase